MAVQQPRDKVISLLSVLEADPTRLLDAVGVYLAGVVEPSSTELLLIDHAGEALMRLDLERAEDVREFSRVEEGIAGAVFREQREQYEHDNGQVSVYTPVTVHSARMGVLRVNVSVPPRGEVTERIRELASALGHVVLTMSRYSDALESQRRRQPLDISAEMQYEMLPFQSFEDVNCVLAGRLEPAYHTAGDLFDYALNGRILTVVLSDAMGHGLESAVLAGVSGAAQRNARRRHLGIRRQVEIVNETLYHQFGGEKFVTQLAMEFDLVCGDFTVIDAGHPLCLRIRGDSLEELESEPDLPLGLFLDADYREQRFAFEPGDRYVLISDGVLEAKPDDGDQFGLERLFALLCDSRPLPPYEVVRKVTRSVMTHRSAPLRDDVTVVCVDLLPGGPNVARSNDR